MSVPADGGRTPARRAIFISYRRNDSEGEAGRLFDDLVGNFGDGSVFMDVAAIEPGRDFRKAIDESVATCGVLLAIVGNNWVDTKNEAGLRRLDDPADFVRLETASALRRDIPVIPVLVRGAKMPRPEQLPDDLKDLAYRNGVELTHARWGTDLQLLIKALRPHVGQSSTSEPAQFRGHAAEGAGVGDRSSEKSADATSGAGPSSVRRHETQWLAVAAGLIVVLALGGYGAYYLKGERDRQALEQQRRVADEDSARRRAEAERADLAQKKAEAERRREAAEGARKVAAEKAAADKAAADRAEADRRREAEEIARRAAAEKSAADRAAADRAGANRRPLAPRDAGEVTAEKIAADKAAVERRPFPVLPPTLRMAPYSAKILSVSCTDRGRGTYWVETSGFASGGALSVLHAGPMLPPKTENQEKTLCSGWSGTPRGPRGIDERACQHREGEGPKTSWKSWHVLDWRASDPPSIAVAQVYNEGKLLAEDRVTFRCKSD